MDGINLTIKSMEKGLRVQRDEVLEPAGSFRTMVNALITDRGGVSKRPGISVIGDYDSNGSPVKGLFAWEKADGSDILLKARGTVHRYLDTTWEDFETGLTASKVGYAPHAVNTEADDYLYYSSRENGYKRWKGWYDRLTTALVGAETEIPVSSVLKVDIFESKTSTSSSTTTFGIAGTPWGTDLWNGFYVHVTSGAKSGKISLITGTANNQITFDAIAGLTGTPTFEIRQLNIPATGTILINGTGIAYTAVSNKDSVTVGSAPVAADNSPVVLVPTSYPLNPKGDAMDVWLTKILVANIKSAMSLDGSGNSVATSAARAIYVSATEDGTDFTFSAPRSADEGDVISLAYGGGHVLDVIAQEDAIYGGTPNYIEEIKYTQTQDASGNPTDILQRKPLKPGIGLSGKFIKGKDDVYFFTSSGEFTSLGRVASLDSTPQSLDIGLPIKRLLEDRVNDDACGIEYRNRLHMAQELNSESSYNDRVLVYNRGKKAFEGDWILPANCFTMWNKKPAFGQSNGSNALQMYSGLNDVWDDTDFPINTEAKSNWINVTPSKMEDQAVLGMHVAGYISGNGEFDVFLMTDYSEEPNVNVNFKGSETDFIYSSTILASLGAKPLGSEPLCSIDEPDENGYRRFRFSVWFPDIYCNVLSWGFRAYGKDEYIELNQIGFTVMADPMKVTPGIIKSK